MFSRNERWHNRPVHVPIDNYENLNFASNASDGELWWCDACKQLWDITGDRKYWLAWQCSLKTCMDYSDIDKYDSFLDNQPKHLRLLLMVYHMNGFTLVIKLLYSIEMKMVI